MANERFRTEHPRRYGLGLALARAFPMPDDIEAKAESRLCRRVDHREAVR